MQKNDGITFIYKYLFTLENKSINALCNNEFTLPETIRSMFIIIFILKLKKKLIQFYFKKFLIKKF